ncbi:MAG: hypothetical protein R3244_10255 [Thermoanaerobaculia bacterium]|nr:hypothetical protein [Thermoanaerobaculia bacterium]
MPGRKIRDRADAVNCLARLERSGQSLVDWVRDNEVDGRSLQCWRMSLSRQSKPTGVVELVADAEPTSTAGNARYLIRRGGFEVEVGDDFEQGTLFRLLEVVAAC